jgi:N-acetyl-anhydromuramyl-L-alanine amidase AmpD
MILVQKKVILEMLEIQSADILSDVKLNINKRKSIKTQIFLYDTQRRLDDFIMKLKYRNNERYEDIPHYIISKSGKIIKIFDTNFSSKTFGARNIDNKMIKIAIENLGWLNKNTITGVLYNWIGDPYRSEPYVKRWRDHYFWDPYPEGQINALVLLCKDICKEHKIPYQTAPSQGYLTNARKLAGIICKSNFLNIYTDMNPSFNFEIFYKDEYKEDSKRV